MAVCKTCGHAVTDEQAKASPFCPRCGVSHDVEPATRGERQTVLMNAMLFVIPILGVLLVLLIKWWRGW